MASTKAKFCAPKELIKSMSGVDSIKINSLAFFIEIALSFCTLCIRPNFTPKKLLKSWVLRFTPCTQLYEIDPRLQYAHFPSFKKSTPGIESVSPHRNVAKTWQQVIQIGRQTCWRDLPEIVSSPRLPCKNIRPKDCPNCGRTHWMEEQTWNCSKTFEI